MGKRDEQRKLKHAVLQLINKEKGILFGAFGENVKKRDKMKVWREINLYAQEIGAIPPDKAWYYIRDAWWPNVRKCALDKINTPEGQEKTLTDIDYEVYDIIGKDSFAILPHDTALSVHQNDNILDQDEMNEASLHDDQDLCKAEITEVQPTSSSGSLRNFPNPTRISIFNGEQNGFYKRRKLEDDEEKVMLQKDLLRVQIYKAKLECHKLEMELGLPNSKYTNNFSVDLKESSQPSLTIPKNK